MILRQYIGNGITSLLAVIFLTIALLTFGYAQYFDRLFIIFLLSLIFFNIHNANIISIALIFLLERFFEEIIFFSSSYLFIKPLIYLLSLWLIKLFWYDKLIRRIILPTVLMCIIGEIYWYLIDYNAPRMHSYIAMLMLNMVTRHLIFLRIPIFKKFQTLSFIKNIVRLPLKHTSVDIQLYSLAMVNILVVVIMIVEYLLRHLTSLEPLFIYNFYSETVHVLSATTLFLIVNFIIKSNYKFAA
tara:strand:- start:11139 stop:11867 length:729 start_codon:yes stop_codon:yes gene_type:complete